MKRVFIVHGWGGKPSDSWFVWLKKQLPNHHVEIIKLPHPETPEIKAWVATLKNAVKKPDKETFFVGHSIGCQTILRYLAHHDGEIGGAVFVAPWFTLTPLQKAEAKIAKPWLTTPVDIHPQHAKKIFALFSSNDYYVPKENIMIYKRLGARVSMQKNKGHLSSHEDGIKTIPIVCKELLRMLR